MSQRCSFSTCRAINLADSAARFGLVAVKPGVSGTLRRWVFTTGCFLCLLQALSRVLSSDGYPLRYLNLSWNNISPTDMKVLCSAMTLGAQPIDDENIAASEAAAAAAVAAGSQTAEQWAGKEVAARKRAYDAAVAHALERFYDTHAKADKQSDLAKVHLQRGLLTFFFFFFFLKEVVSQCNVQTGAQISIGVFRKARSNGGTSHPTIWCSVREVLEFLHFFCLVSSSVCISSFCVCAGQAVTA